MKIYTKTGDKGETGLFGGSRVSKADRRVEAYGTVDELNSVLSVVIEYLLQTKLPMWIDCLTFKICCFVSVVTSPPWITLNQNFYLS